MTGFFEHQDRARRMTRVLVLLMALGVLAVGSAIYALLLVVVPWFAPFEGGGRLGTFDLRLLGLTIGITALVVAAASIGRVFLLGGGGAQIAEMMGGRLVSGDARDALEKRLVNVVEEMAIASGVPVPQVFVLDGETGINAFAAGLVLDDAAVAVTRGALEALTRDELQGVVAHEFSHVLNGDMRLNVRLMGIVFGIVCIALLGRLLLRGGSSSRTRRGGGGAVVVLGLGMLLIGSIGEFFGKLIKAAVSRQREFLADASAVQFTRNPAGIAGALKKIGGFGARSRVNAPSAEEASHFFFGDIKTRLFEGGVLATHPPLAERVRRIDPSFDGEFAAVRASASEVDAAVSGFAPAPARVSTPAPSGQGSPAEAAVFDPRWVEAHVGTIDAAALAESQRLIASLASPLRKAANSPFGASALVYALLLADGEQVRAVQLERIAALASPTLRDEALRLLPALAELPRRDRLPLVALCAPALRDTSAAQRGAFTRTVDALVEADARISIFEYVVGATLRDRLAPKDERHPGRRHRRLASVRGELELLLSLLAHAGAGDEGAASRAFAAGASRLREHGVRLELLAPSERLLSALAPALAELRGLSPLGAGEVVRACAHVVLQDRRVTDDEATLLRAVCDALRCPLPPFAAA